MPPMSNTTSFAVLRRVRKGMGWFSLGLGTLQLLAPDAVNRLCGLRPGRVRRKTQGVMGRRELLAAGGLLTRTNGSGWMKARVVGDFPDIALLTKSRESSTRRSRTS